MNKKQFEKLAQKLYAKGYQKFDQQLNNEDYVIAKGFHKQDNKWDEDRHAYQILLSVYDYTERTKTYYDRLPASMKQHVGIEIRFCVSRTIDERIDLQMAWHNNTIIEEVESQAEEFYKWVNFVWFKPRKEEENEE